MVRESDASGEGVGGMADDAKKLVIIDGKSVFYRGYYAMGHLSKKDGTPTGGVYGFAVIAMEIVKKLQPDKVVVAWDKAKTSVAKRKAIYADYKAGRVKPPEDFFAQIPLLRELVADLGWGFLECDEYEADDIIGTLARQADEETELAFQEARAGWMTYIVSSDLDMLQIVDENTRMYRLLKGFSQLEEMDVAAVEVKYGIEKQQFLDLKALKGDASDNIPGVPGIGEKTAVKLLNAYGDLDGVYAHIDEITGAVQKKLIAGKESAYMSYQLGKIMTDAPVKLDEVPDLVVDGERIVARLKELEFYSLVRRFRDALRGGADNAVLGARPDSRPVPGDVIVDYDVKGLMHRQESVAEKIFQGEKFWDLEQGRFLLDPLARVQSEEKQLGLDLESEEAKNQKKQQEYWRQQEEYEKLPKLRKILLEYDLPLIPVLYQMEKAGMMLDLKYFEQLKTEVEAQVQEIEQKIYTVCGMEFNLNSPIQMSEVLYEKLALPTKGIKKTARGYSTGVKELEKLKELHPVIPLIMEYREVAKLLSTYIVPLPELADEQGRVHTTFTQNVTATGRLSSVNPNLQNIPVRTEEGRKIRTGFVAGEGRVLVQADYAQFELRLAAVLAGDQALIDDFNAGIDIHTKTAAEVFGVPMEEVTKSQRRAAKVINFGVMYGMSAKGLSDATDMTVAEAKQFIADYFEVRRPIKDFLERTLAQARELGYVETYYGRRRPTPDVKSTNYIVRMGAERAAQNMPIQGTEADLMKRAMIRVYEKLPKGAELVMQVHDSLIVECDAGLADEVAKILQETMEAVAPELPVKLLAEATIGENWGEL